MKFNPRSVIVHSGTKFGVVVIFMKFFNIKYFFTHLFKLWRENFEKVKLNYNNNYIACFLGTNFFLVL